MKKYLKIQNDGVLDIRLVALMGGSTKTESEYKIGQFGTGLKYVLAYLFRNDIEFKVFASDRELDISLEKELIGNEEFDIVCINGNRTSITTKMGLDWEPWMIVREIYSNALDEGGELYEVTENIVYEDGKTIFYIELTPKLMEVYNNWNKYFIVGNIPMYENNSFSVHPSGQNLKIYKHGILIHESEQKSIFNYDIKYASINELREYKGFMELDVYNCISQLDKKSIEYFLENCKDDHYEGQMDYHWHGEFSSQWQESIGSAKIIHQEAIDNIKARGVNIDLSETITLPKKVYKALTKRFEGIGALRVAKKVGDFFEIHNDELDLKINKCLAILESCGYYMDPELKFIFGVFGDNLTLAKIDIDKKEIMISEKHLNKSIFDTCATIIEENEHYKTGFDDCSRNFQQHFIDLYVKTLLDKNQIEI